MQFGRALVSFMFLGASVVGCGDSDVLSVRGNVELSLGGASSGFDFMTDTRLYDDRVMPSDGAIAGHCTIRSRSDRGDAVSVGISRAGADDLGMRGVVIDLESVERGRNAGSVEVVAGARTLGSDTGAQCVLDVASYDADSGHLAFDVACEVRDASGAGHVNGSLEVSGCARASD